MSVDPIGQGLNINSLRIQRNFQNNQLSLEKSLERLSSGLRINRASDDPSGITRARQTETRLISAGQALSNTQEASLLTATASATVQQMMDGLQNLRSLVLESLNETTRDNERLLLQNRFKQGVQELDKLARSSRFNQRALLDGQAAPLQVARTAEARILFNREVTDTSTTTPTQSFFIEDIVAVDPNIRTDAVFQFRLFESSAEFSAGLEIIASNLGTVVSTDNYLAFPNTYNLPVNTQGQTVTLNLASLGYNEVDPLSLNEYQNVSLSQLVADRRLLPISYGGLNLTLGGVTYNNALNVQPGNTLEEIVNALNSLSVAEGSFSASFDPGTSRISLSYTNQRALSNSSLSSYTPAVPGAAGGGFASFAALPAAAEGPAYSDPTGGLPAAPFDPMALPPGSLFPTLPAALDSSLNFSGSDASIMNALGLSNVSTSGEVSAYTTGHYSGETVATGGQSEYVNRTALEILSISSQNQLSGSNTGLSTLDVNSSFRALNTAQVNTGPFGAGDFSIDFGSNGVLNFSGFDPSTSSIDAIVSSINTYAANSGAQVSASFDTSTNQLRIENTALDAKITDPGLAIGAQFTIDFGEGRIFDADLQLGGFDPDNLSLNDLVAALDGFAPGISASLDAASGTLQLQNTALDLDGNGPNNQIIFGGSAGVALADLFQLSANSASTALSSGDSQSISSSTAIDNRSINPLLALDAADLSRPLGALFVSEGNAISLMGPNGSNLASFFQLAAVAGSNNPGDVSIAQSAGDISSQALDPLLDISPADLSGKSLTALMTPRLNSLVSGELRLNGDLVLTVDPDSTRLSDLVNALNGFTGSGNQVYSASFDSDVAGGLRLSVTDTELLSPLSGVTAASPGNIQIDGNRIIRDSAAYIADSAPLSYNGGTPLGSGSGPAEQLVFGPGNLSPEYSLTPPDPSSANISGISFSGSNLASVLFLNNSASGSPILVAGSDQFRGSITATSSNSYALEGEYQQSFSATTNLSSSQQLGYETPLGQNPEFGVVAQLYVRAGQNAVTEDRALRIQTGLDAGQNLQLGIQELSARTLRLEGLDLIGTNPTQTYLKGLTALNVLDDALDTGASVLAQLGAYQNSLDRGAERLLEKQGLLAAELSQVQDADIPTEISRMSRAQINVQAAAAALNENNLNQREIARLLFGGLNSEPFRP